MWRQLAATSTCPVMYCIVSDYPDSYVVDIVFTHDLVMLLAWDFAAILSLSLSLSLSADALNYYISTAISEQNNVLDNSFFNVSLARQYDPIQIRSMFPSNEFSLPRAV